MALKLVMALEGGDPQDILEEYADLAPWAQWPMWCLCWGKPADRQGGAFPFWPRAAGPGWMPSWRKSGMGGKKATATSLAFTVIPRINATRPYGLPGPGCPPVDL